MLWSINALEVLTTIIMADALRRINKSVSDNEYLESNAKTMCLHITMCTLHVTSYSIAVFFAIRAFKMPENGRY